MSQRGSRFHETLKHVPAMGWVTIWTICILSVTITLLPTLSLIAQDIQPKLAKMAVVLRVGNSERRVETDKQTVQTVLHQEHIALGTHDKCEPAVTTPVTEGMTITVTRVTQEIRREKLAVPAPTVTRWSRYATTTPVVIRAGKPGVAVQTRVVWKKNGVVSQQWVQNKRVIVQPKPKIVVKGNRLPSRSGMDPMTITVTSTAYTPYDAGCNGTTANGMRAGYGVIAVDPRVIPMGSRVYVEGYGWAIAADTGGAIKGKKIDVCYPSKREAFKWGRRSVKITVY